MTQSECPVCGVAESYINHRHHCWERDRREKFYNFTVPGEREKYMSTLCDSCKAGNHVCYSGRKCYCPYYGCATGRKSKLKWDLRKYREQLKSNEEEIADLKQKIKANKKDIKVTIKEIADLPKYKRKGYLIA